MLTKGHFDILDQSQNTMDTFRDLRQMRLITLRNMYSTLPNTDGLIL